MTFQEIAGKITGSAPKLGALIGTFAGGPVGAAAGGVLGEGIQVLAKAFGITSPQPTPEEIDAAITQDPQSALKLRLAEMDYEARQQDQGLEALKAQLGDVQSARSMQIETTKATGRRDINLYVLSWVITIGFFMCFIVLFFVPVPEANKQLFTYLFVTLQTGTILCWSFYYGTSQGQNRATELLAKAPPVKE